MISKLSGRSPAGHVGGGRVLGDGGDLRWQCWRCYAAYAILSQPVPLSRSVPPSTHFLSFRQSTFRPLRSVLLHPVQSLSVPSHIVPSQTAPSASFRSAFCPFSSISFLSVPCSPIPIRPSPSRLVLSVFSPIPVRPIPFPTPNLSFWDLSSPLALSPTPNRPGYSFTTSPPISRLYKTLDFSTSH